MITKIFDTTTVADGSTERLTVHTKIGEFEVPGKRITCHVRPRDNDEYDAEFGKALAKKKFDILSTDDRIGQHMTMAKNLRAIAKNLMDIADKEERVADDMCGKIEDMKYKYDFFVEEHFHNAYQD